MTTCNHFPNQNLKRLRRSTQPFVLAMQLWQWRSWWTLRRSCQLSTKRPPTSTRLSFSVCSCKEGGWDAMFQIMPLRLREKFLQVFGQLNATSCFWAIILCALVWTESRGTERSSGDAVSCGSAERGVGYQRPPGGDWTTYRLSSGLHQHRPR